MTKQRSINKSSVSKKSAVAGKVPREAVFVSLGEAFSAPLRVDEATGSASLKRVMPLLVAIPAAEVFVPTLNLRLAALAALGVHGLIESLGLVPRLQLQAKIGELDISQLELLVDLARATYHLRLKVEQASAVVSEAMVPAALAARGQEQRRRMLKLLDFHFEDSAQVAPRLAFIRSGTGYHDLAADLFALVELYQEHKNTLKQTPNHYFASDEKEAARTAAELMAWLSGDAAGSTGNAALASDNDLANRAGHLMVRAYDEVIAVVRYLCRRDPALAARFPSLYALTRSRSAAGPDEETPAADGPGGQDAADSQPTA